MRLTAVQFKPTRTDKAGSLARLAELCRAAAVESDLVVLPEMAATGYVFASAEELRPAAEPARGQTFEALAPIAREAGCWIVCGFPETDGDRLFNSALVIDDRGELAWCYRKTLLFESDMSWATPGDSGYRVLRTRAGTFTVGICMDLNDDRFVQWCAEQRPDAIAFPTNWLDQGHPIWSYWAWRLQETESILVAADTYGDEGALRFIGTSAIMDRTRVFAAAPPEGDCIIRANIEQVRRPAA